MLSFVHFKGPEVNESRKVFSINVGQKIVLKIGAGAYFVLTVARFNADL
jgi:hypothetical protein